MTSRADAAGTTDYGYDGAGRLSTVTNAGVGLSLTDSYNVDSQLASISYGSSGDVRAFGYDAQHRLTSDVLTTPAGAMVASIGYGYDADGNETSKTTSGFAGSASNIYTYDLANRLTSWDNGTTVSAYAYDKSGNRVQVGNDLYTYDARDQLVSKNGTTSYTYTLRGTLASVDDGSVVQTRTDAFGQVVSQDSPAGTQAYGYDAFGRVIRPGFAYSGTGNTLAGDGSATYVRDPGDGLVGVAVDGAGVAAWTDQHTDVVGEFTADASALSGSMTYDPLGVVLASSGMSGHLGYQSEWTDTATGRVNMAARWYDPGTGQFDSRDSVAVSPLPDSAAADPFGYANDDPLLGMDPTGHCWLCMSTLKKAYHATTSVVSTAYHATVSGLSTAYHATVSGLSSAYHDTTSAISTVWNDTKALARSAYDKAKTVVKAGIKKVSKVISAAKKKVTAAVKKAVQTGKAVVAKATKVVKTAADKVADAYKASAKWVVEHKDTLIEIGAMATGIIAGLACTVATGAVAVGACLVGTSAIINLAKDAAEGNIHSWTDALKSAGSGAEQGLLGIAGGAVGGKIASTVLGKIGGRLLPLAGRVLGGAISGGTADALTQAVTTGKINPWEVGESAGIGGLFGAKAPRGRTPAYMNADNVTAGGHDVSYSETATAVGSDPRTQNNMRNVKPIPGVHDVVAHGTPDGFLDLDGEITNGGQLVDAVRANPAYKQGMPCRLLVCHAGVSGVGQQVADELGVSVLAPNDRVGTMPALGPGQEPLVDNNAGWTPLRPRTEGD